MKHELCTEMRRASSFVCCFPEFFAREDSSKLCDNRRRNSWRVMVGNRVPNTLMDSAGGTKRHVAQVLFAWNCRRTEQRVLDCPQFTLRAPLRRSTGRNTCIRIDDVPHVDSADSVVCLPCARASYVPIEAGNSHGSNSTKMSDCPSRTLHLPLSSIDKSCAPRLLTAR